MTEQLYNIRSFVFIIMLKNSCRVTYYLTILVDLQGRVVAVNDRDADGQPIDTAFLYEKNFANSEWFKAVSNGRFTTRTPHTAPGNDISDGTFRSG